MIIYFVLIYRSCYLFAERGKLILSKKVLITPKSYYRIRKKMLPLLQNYEVKFNDTGKTFTENQMIELAKEVEGIIIGVDPITEEVIANAKNLKAISKYGVGMDNIDIDAARANEIKLSKTPGTNNISVAELAIGLMFDAARNISHAVQKVKNQEWQRSKGVELTGKTLGLVGCGKIGKEVARRARGLLMSVYVYDPYFEDEEFARKYDLEMVDLDSLINNADFISLHLPLNEETENYISRPELSKMKSSAYLINTARGGLIAEDDLLWALEKGEIVGAACDVFSEEPAGNHPLLNKDNFLLTPHMGANTAESVLRMATDATENLLEMLDNC